MKNIEKFLERLEKVKILDFAKKLLNSRILRAIRFSCQLDFKKEFYLLATHFLFFKELVIFMIF